MYLNEFKVKETLENLTSFASLELLYTRHQALVKRDVEGPLEKMFGMFWAKTVTPLTFDLVRLEKKMSGTSWVDSYATKVDLVLCIVCV